MQGNKNIFPLNILSKEIITGVIKNNPENKMFKENVSYSEQAVSLATAYTGCRDSDTDSPDNGEPDDGEYYLWTKAEETGFHEKNDPAEAIVLFKFGTRNNTENIIVPLGKFDNPNVAVEKIIENQVTPVDMPVSPSGNNKADFIAIVNQKRKVYRWFDSEHQTGWRLVELPLLDILDITLSCWLEPETMGIPARYTSLAEKSDKKNSCVSFTLDYDGTFDLYHKYDSPDEMFNDEFAMTHENNQEEILISTEW